MTKFRGQFKTPYDQYHEHNGKVFEVLGPVDPSTYDSAEVGTMWRIRLGTGEVIEAWPEEVEEDAEQIG